MKEHHFFIGRLTKDAEQREIGESVVFNFTIAVDTGYTDKNGNWVDQSKFIECAFWRSKKSISGIRYSTERLVKGNMVQITSNNMSARAFQKRENGTPKIDNNGDPVLQTVQTAKVTEIEFLIVDKSRINQGQQAQLGNTVVVHSETADNTKDDLPF
jgi:single-stranded DNA-binding protein